MAGAHTGDVVFGDKIVVDGNHNVGKYVSVTQPAAAPAPRRHRILMLMSNPLDTGHLRLDEEHRAIDRAIAGARYRDHLELQTGPAARVDDLQALLLRHRPVVVHYAGHHSAGEGIVLTDADGGPRTVPPAALTDLFAILRGSIKCVVLNACLTHDQAAAIAEHVPCVVGMTRAVLDPVAIAFAGAFYQAVADGRSIDTAFRLGRNHLLLNAPSGGVVRRDLAGEADDPSGADDPVLLAAPGVAERTFITP